MHRLIMNPPAGMVVDHVDGNKQDGRRRNLRVCTQAENLLSRRKRHGTSRFKGVSWHSGYCKWVARVNQAGKAAHLGWSDDEIEVAKAYDQAARRLFGQFARLDFLGAENIVWLSGLICMHSHAYGRLTTITVNYRQDEASCHYHPTCQTLDGGEHRNMPTQSVGEARFAI